MLGVESFSGGFLPGEGGLSHVPYPPPMPPTGAWKHLCVVIRYKRFVNVKLKKKLGSTCPTYLVFRDDVPRHLHLTTPRTPPSHVPLPLLPPTTPLPPLPPAYGLSRALSTAISPVLLTEQQLSHLPLRRSIWPAAGGIFLGEQGAGRV
jgi:hypothetical protein